jgi:hypothetical protein
MKGFEVTGMCPFNQDIFSELHFLPSTVTDVPSLTSNCSLDTNEQLSASVSLSVLAVDEPGASGYIPIDEISPLPRAQHVQHRRRTGKKSEVLNEPPFKVQLEAQVAEKNNKKDSTTKTKRNYLR